MQPIVNTATPHQTSARRCVTILAMESLMGMSKPPFNTNRHEHSNAVGELEVRLPA